MSANPKSLPDVFPAAFKDTAQFYAELCDVYGDELAVGIAAQLGQASRLSFWVNPLRTGWDQSSQQAVLADTGLPPSDLHANPQLEGLWSARVDGGLTHSNAANDASIYIQNPSSLLAVRALAPQEEQEVLDLAAAPGGKTIAMAVAMRNSGRIAAVESVKARFFRLQANVERCGVSNVDFYLRDGRGVGRAVPERFDKVLLDAPCSSEARIRWFDASSYAHWSRRKVKEAQRKQKRLLRSAYDALKPGGSLVYCTCSFSVAENEAVVHHLLQASDAQVQPLELDLPPHKAGVTTWRGKAMPPSLAQTIRVLPDAVWDGFYLALLRKPGPN